MVLAEVAVRLPGIDEEVERVESFEELRPGLVLWVLDCLRCSGRCRCMVTVPAKTPRAWRVVPKCIDNAEHQIVSAEGIAQGRTYRVVDAKFDAETDTIARVRKLSKGPVVRAYERLLAKGRP